VVEEVWFSVVPKDRGSQQDMGQDGV